MLFFLCSATAHLHHPGAHGMAHKQGTAGEAYIGWMVCGWGKSLSQHSKQGNTKFSAKQDFLLSNTFGFTFFKYYLKLENTVTSEI